MPTKVPSAYALWLMPALPEQRQLDGIVRGLADRLGGPTFEPHVTLCSGPWVGNGQTLEDLMRSLAGTRQPFWAEVRGVAGAPGFFTPLYAPVALPEDLVSQAVAEFPGSHAQRVGPHLALYYGEPSYPRSHTMLAADVANQLPTSIRFDALQLVAPTAGDWHDVSRWRTLAAVPLGGRAAR